MRTRKVAKLIKAGELRREATMHAENSSTNQSTERHPVEGVLKSVPEAHALVATVAFFEESIDTVDSRTFMITTEHKEVFRILDFVAEHQADCFNVLTPTVDIV